jgi:hypothetical protein
VVRSPLWTSTAKPRRGEFVRQPPCQAALQSVRLALLLARKAQVDPARLPASREPVATRIDRGDGRPPSASQPATSVPRYGRSARYFGRPRSARPPSASAAVVASDVRSARRFAPFARRSQTTAARLWALAASLLSPVRGAESPLAASADDPDPVPVVSSHTGRASGQGSARVGYRRPDAVRRSRRRSAPGCARR